MTEVNILSEMETTLYPTVDTPQRVVMIQYQVGQAPVRTLTIPKAEYRHQDLPRLIREDMEKAKTQGPRTIEV